MEKSNVSECGIKRFKASSHVEITSVTINITFFDIKGVVHFEFIPQGQTVSQAFYVEILKRLCELFIE
jgi:hypothetical protein